MFIDRIDIFIVSGNGGSGAISFRKEKFIIHGGPDGGDGGRGGSVFFKTSYNMNTLVKFRGMKYYKANDGMPGGKKHCKGKNGEDLILEVPLGTQIFNFETREMLADLNQPNTLVKLLDGGEGGRGNARFKNSINQAPFYSQNGMHGSVLHVYLELKLIADIGLVGYPNVGKSSLISILSNAKPKIANYEFTTLSPHLGVVKVDDFNSFIMADIPGIIDGASSGKGLGLDFLKHIERTKFLLFVLDSKKELDVRTQYKNLRKEINLFSETLSQYPFGIIVNKIDLISSENKINEIINSLIQHFSFSKDYDLYLNKNLKYCSFLSSYLKCNTSINNIKSTDSPLFIFGVSSITYTNIQRLKFILHHALSINFS